MHISTAIRAFLGIAILAPLIPALAQQQPLVLGGEYKQLLPQQQALMKRWTTEYGAIVKRRLDPAETYNALPLSARTTFQAVTHALSNTRLTTQAGKSLGTALDLVDTVERIAGQVPDTRGDRQFRVYVYLKPGAVNKLYTAKEFERGHDNSTYHIGYPMNFRQKGGTPSIQFSVARTGIRADIDVDYRSSSGIKALTSGHLTSANSDVRAGDNPNTHNRRWSGLSNWWRDLMAAFVEKPAPEESVQGLSPGAEAERKRIARGPIDEAINSYLTDWLVKEKPQDLLPLFSVKSYPCVAEFGGDARPDSRLALTRIMQRLRERSDALGKISALEEAVQAVSYRLPGSVPIKHPYEKVFSLQEVPDDAAWAIDCRIRYKLHLAESIPRPEHKLNKTYVASMRVKDSKEPQAFTVMTWAQEAGEWRVVSIDLKRKTLSPPTDLLSAAQPTPARNSDAAQVAEEAEKLFTTWLVKRQPDEAIRFFLPEANDCDPSADGQASAKPSAPDPNRLRFVLSEILKAAPANDRLEGVIASAEAGHHEMKLIPHERDGAFLLASVSPGFLRAHSCRAGAPASEIAGMATIFRLVLSNGDANAAITLFWIKSNGEWRVPSYSITVD
jgi:hypothetical protein